VGAFRGAAVRNTSWLFKLLEFYSTQLHHRGQWWVHLRLRRLLAPNLNVDLEVVRDGRRWLLNPSDFVQAELFWLGEMDSWDVYHIRRQIPRFLERDSTLFDIGANFGYYAITLAEILERRYDVYAVEPVPATYERLCRNVALNDLGATVHTYRVGFSDASGVGTVIERPGNSGAARIARGEEEGPQVPLMTLDSLCVARAIRKVGFMKVDVEGSEERLLIGGAETIEQCKPLIHIELNPVMSRHARSSVEQVVSLLRDYGYDLYVAQRNRLGLLRQLPRGGDHVNALCFPKGRAPAS
jgi:FkbM family methyltransferase